ncbi:hypothetical protein H310_08855 [Aphanomyces invadans]|uniref:Rubisco LSMT substrate-binding domain-containing protein n=1 Tax=Aphanomyces invadans TaxID=157072 RepID=A0A024TWT9_9STRA|nr:hypothetical protein H310_08855 [Aphanomyces invadans]ETV98111.1 hypothetical protein H310_08855 [Aphanomyces invadans]|eukprot:XP_008872986.1 hypothetical protein H310_08855 [Aphanomyces invadans]
MLPLRKITLLVMSSFVLAGDGIPRFDSVKRAIPGHGLILDSHTVKPPPDRHVDVELIQESDHEPTFRLLHDDVVHSPHSHKVELSGITPGRGARYVAAFAIASGEEILSIPMEDVMSVHTAKHGRIHRLVDANPHLPPAVVLALHLLEERSLGPASKWHDFIQTLPTTFHSAIYLTDDEWDIIQGSHVARLIEIRRKAIADFFDALESPLTSNAVDPPFFTPAQFTLKTFQWAMAAVWAHTILVPKLAVDASARLADDSDLFDAVLVPIVSTLTPCDDCDNVVHVQDGYVTLVASQPLAAGDEVQFHLGANSLAVYMLNHGFAPSKPSPLDVVAIGLQVEASDPLLVFKNQILAMMNTTMDESYTPAYGTARDTILSSMLPSMRAKVLAANEMDRVQRVLDGDIVSLRNEHAVCRALYQTVQTMLRQFATPPDQVDQAVRRNDLPPRTKDLLRTVQVEQHVLLATQDAIRVHWDQLLVDDSILAHVSKHQTP